MKKNTFLFALVITLYTTCSFSQSFNYQAAVRNTAGDLVTDQPIGVQIKLLQGNATGTAVYTEIHNVTSNNQGVISLAIGSGTTSDTFSAIDWSTQNYWLEIAVDITGGTTYTVIGTSQLLSVPYALHAKTSEIGDDLGNHTATMDIDVNTNNITGVNSIRTGTIISTAANATINTSSLTGGEGIILSGSTSDYSISVQDGNGRIQHKWNATHGINENFIVAGEDAAFIDINATAANDEDAWLEFKHADGAGASAGTPIAWNTQMIINQGGEVGINETSPDDMLHVTAAGNGTRVRLENTGNGWAGMIAKNTQREIFVGIQGAFDANPGEFHIFDNTVGARRLVIDASGEVGIGRNNPSVKLDVNGSVNCTGGTCSSDERWKKNIGTLPNAIENIKQMRGVSYFWRTEAFPDQNFKKDKQIGLIAQEVEKIYPELVKTNEEGYKSMDYMSLTAVLLEGIKEQQQQIEILESRLDEVEKLKAMLLTMQSNLKDSQ